MKHLVIIGAGFCGQTLIKKCARLKEFKITIISDSPFITNKPLFPDVAGGSVAPSVISFPLTQFAARYGADVMVGNVSSIDFTEKKVLVEGTCIQYDYCVIATGTHSLAHSFLARNTTVYTIDSLPAVSALHDHFLRLMRDDSRIQRIVVIGGGYTGIEFVSHVIRSYKRKKIRYEITILERGEAILNGLSSRVQERVRDYLSLRGVKIRMRTQVTDIKDGNVVIGDELIPADCIVWCAGMEGVELNARLGLPHTNGRIIIDEFLRPRGTENLFVAGDAAFGQRMSVPIAKQYGAHTARQIKNMEKGFALKAFKARDYGYVIGLAEGEGIGAIIGLPMRSIYGYLFHYFMCALSLIGFKNKLRLVKSMLQGGGV